VLLEGKNAVIYGGAGSIGRAVARRFAAEGAIVHLAGRTLEPVEKVAKELRAADGAAEAAEVDALDEQSVEDHAAAVLAGAGSIDVSLNVISLGEVFGSPLAEARLEDFERPITRAVRSAFLTATAAARQMIRQGSGVILTFGGYGKPISDFYLGGFQVGLSAVDALRRQLAAELGPYGIRVLTLQSTGVPETIPEDFGGRDATTEEIVGRTMLNRAATLEDVGRVAAFAASDHARAMTATALNITCGDEVD
jgi:3-oxoacyl-[acyl-carrier protein] reductase